MFNDGIEALAQSYQQYGIKLFDSIYYYYLDELKESCDSNKFGLGWRIWRIVAITK